MTLTLGIRRYNPDVSKDSWWDEFTVEADPIERLVEVLHQVKWQHDGTAHLPSLVRARDLRLRRDAHQRPQRARLQGPRQGRRAARSPSSRSAACRC